MAKSFVFIGGTGRGKTTGVKNLLRKMDREVLIYDVNNEYPEFTKKKPLPDLEDFLEQAKEARNKIIVFEEATIFFKNRTVRAVTEVLVRKRHTGNVPVFVFHSLRSVPIDILELIDYITLHATGDNSTLIEKKFRDNDVIIEAYREVKENTLKKKKGEKLYYYKKFFTPL